MYIRTSCRPTDAPAQNNRAPAKQMRTTRFPSPSLLLFNTFGDSECLSNLRSISFFLFLFHFILFFFSIGFLAALAALGRRKLLQKSYLISLAIILVLLFGRDTYILLYIICHIHLYCMYIYMLLHTPASRLPRYPYLRYKPTTARSLAHNSKSGTRLFSSP